MTKTKTITIINIFILLTLISVYAFQVVQLNECDYRVSSYQQQINQAKQSIAEMENVYASHSSLNGIWPMIHDLNFEEVKEVAYIRVSEPVFAVSR